MANDSRKNPKQSAREAAAAAKAASEAQQKKRERLITIIGIVVVVVIIGAIVGAVVISKANAGKVALPKTVTKPTYGYPVNPSSPKSTPLVQVFEDFQCPICAEFQKAGGPKALEAEANAGKIQLNLQPLIFLDQNLNNDSSIRATNAWGCAIDQGVGTKYHEVVFANQPAKEGAGYTDVQLIQFGQQAGLTGSAFNTFAKCVPTQTYFPWANKAADYGASVNVNSTPTVLVNGKVLDIEHHTDWFTNPQKLVAAIYALANKK